MSKHGKQLAADRLRSDLGGCCILLRQEETDLVSISALYSSVNMEMQVP